MSVGGSIESVTIDGVIFAVTADADVTRHLGGDQNEVETNGDGSSRIIKTKTAWKLDGLVLSIDDLREDQEFLQAHADLKSFFTVLISFASGAKYDGQGQITGDLVFSSKATTATVSFTGTGKLSRQS